jgi:hypothetical protein
MIGGLALGSRQRGSNSSGVTQARSLAARDGLGCDGLLILRDRVVR